MFYINGGLALNGFDLKSQNWQRQGCICRFIDIQQEIGQNMRCLQCGCTFLN